MSRFLKLRPGYVIIRTIKEDRGNGTSRKIVKYRTGPRSWSKSKAAARIYSLGEGAKFQRGDVLAHTQAL